MAQPAKPQNPFYILLILVGLVFAVTTVAYGVMAVVELRTANLPDGAVEHPLLAWLRHHGERAMLIELALLALFTFAAIGTDSWWAHTTERTTADATPPSGTSSDAS